jgi:hypothetical protein
MPGWGPAAFQASLRRSHRPRTFDLVPVVTAACCTRRHRRRWLSFVQAPFPGSRYSRHHCTAPAVADHQHPMPHGVVDRRMSSRALGKPLRGTDHQGTGRSEHRQIGDQVDVVPAEEHGDPRPDCGSRCKMRRTGRSHPAEPGSRPLPARARPTRCPIGRGPPRHRGTADRGSHRGDGGWPGLGRRPADHPCPGDGGLSGGGGEHADLVPATATLRW